jgi:molybdopterin-guanine dinucleotide biosynthesis protein A
MGENKAFIEIEGVPIIHRIHTLFKNLFQEIVIVTNQQDLFLDLESKIYSDLIPERGVLGGLYTGLFFSSFPYSFCVACDMPFLKTTVIEYLIKNIEDYDVIVPKTSDGLQPLHAVYSKNCLGPIKEILDQGKYKIIDLYPMVKVKIMEEGLKYLDPMGESFININTPEELYHIKKRKAIG